MENAGGALGVTKYVTNGLSKKSLGTALTIVDPRQN